MNIKIKKESIFITIFFAVSIVSVCAGEETKAIALLRDSGTESSNIQSDTETADTCAVSTLVELMKDESSGIREYVAELLGDKGNTSAIPVLIEALKDTFPVVRKSAVMSLGKISDSSIVPVLINMLDDKDTEVRKNTVEALGKFGDASIVPNLVKMLNDKDAEVRKSTVKILGTIDTGDSSVIVMLMNVLKKDKDWLVRKEAAFVLGNIGNPSIPFLIKELKGSIKGLVALSLGKTGNVSLVPVLKKALNDENPETRKYVAQAMGYLGRPAVVALMTTLSTPNENKDKRKYAAEALGIVGDSMAVPVLIEALNEKSEDIKNSAAEALKNIGQYAVDMAAKKLVEDEHNFDVCFKNAVFLAKFGDGRSLLLLVEALKLETYVEKALPVLEKYYGGKVKKVSESKEILCPACEGSGICSGCKGTGKSGEGIMFIPACEWCDGSGKCFICKGEGKIIKVYYKYIYVPAAEGKVSIGMPEVDPGNK